MWDLPSPSSMSYFWNLGATLGIVLVVQITTGLLLTMHYTSYSEQSFLSVVTIIKETWSGWAIRLTHINGASIFFAAVYLHMSRGLFFSSYNKKSLWNRGVTILITLMAISFIGYVLPWGQISYWAVAVITNLFSVIPVVGSDLVQWIWGGFNVASPTLTRFYSLHFLLPLVLTAIVTTHLLILHSTGSNNPIGVRRDIDKVQFHPYFSTKDLNFVAVAFVISAAISFFAPFLIGDPVNMIPANPIQTPLHIQPEWYFLTSYAILRAIPRKVAGVICLALSVCMFYALPQIKRRFAPKFRIYRTIFYWSFISLFWSLTKMGSIEAEEPYIIIGKIISISYLTSIIMMAWCPDINCFENNRRLASQDLKKR